VGAFRNLTKWRKLRKDWQLQCRSESCSFLDKVCQALDIMHFILCKKCSYINREPLKFQLPFDTSHILTAFCSSTHTCVTFSILQVVGFMCFGTLHYFSMRHILFALHFRTHPSCVPVTYKVCMWVGIAQPV